MDLFASRLNHKVTRYCAWQPDPGALVIDSFTMSWGSEKLVYAFPPFSIAHKVLQKMIYGEAIWFVVAPFWPTQPWFSLFTKLICGIPVTFEVNTNELYLPFSCVGDMKQPGTHPLAGQLTMVAALCNGRRISAGKVRPCESRASPRTLSIQCSRQEEAPIESMHHIWPSGKHIVINGRWITTRRLFLRRWAFYSNCWKTLIKVGVIVPFARLDLHWAQL